MWLLENFKGLVWLTFYFPGTEVLRDLKKIPGFTATLILPLGKMQRWSLACRVSTGDGDRSCSQTSVHAEGRVDYNTHKNNRCINSH